MSSCPESEVIERLAAGTLAGDERGALLDHAAGCADCRAMVEASPRVVGDEPDRVGRYVLERELGRGATGVVYAARDPELARAVAVKVLRPHAPAERLRREAQALAKLTHANVVRVYDVGEHAGELFIAMELVEGQNLREWLRVPRALSAILDVVIRAGHGLAAAHRAGLVHRDFKPDNVLIARSGDVLVGDFGLARTSDVLETHPGPLATAVAGESIAASLTATGALVGTPAYMAPELVASEATPASDQFAFCVTAWEACFGTRPFAGATFAELVAAATAGRFEHLDRDVPARIERVLQRGLAAKPGDRFSSIEALLHALQPRRRRAPWIAAGGVVAVVVGIAAIVLASGQPAEPSCDVVAWPPAMRAELAARWGESVASEVAQYAVRWESLRAGACRSDRRDQLACLDRARATMQATIDAMLATPRERLSRPELVVETLPVLERCDGAIEPGAAIWLAPIVETLDAELARADLELLAGWNVSRAQLARLRARAESVGHGPQILRALILEARGAHWTGESRAAEAIFQRVLVRAEELGDDHARASAGAWLARVLAERSPDEADRVLAIAAAAARRAGLDPALEQGLQEAEIAIAQRRGDHARAVAVQDKLVALAVARHGATSPIAAHAYTRLWSLAYAAGDLDKATAAYDRATAIMQQIGAVEHADPRAVLAENTLAPLVRGDYAGTIAVARRQLAAVRELPVQPANIVGSLLYDIGFAHDLAGEPRPALAAYTEAEAAWRRPGDYASARDVAAGIATAIIGRAGMLYALGEHAAALREFERALAHARANELPDELATATRWVGIACVATGDHRRARDLLASQPLPDAPYARALQRFALARALWVDGGLRDRPRALALAADAERDTTEAIAIGDRDPALRRLPALARELAAEIEAWRRTR